MIFAQCVFLYTASLVLGLKPQLDLDLGWALIYQALVELELSVLGSGLSALQKSIRDSSSPSN